ncbi:ABC transporter ATP-binding protein [Nocardioides sp. LHG3406-4]|uniref:ABC transporter ATP-binding protein n=1 Tax=Nocardioides sp. LHG3406-4 TaxID=2804575 RepID=UPI003CEB9C56
MSTDDAPVVEVRDVHRVYGRSGSLRGGKQGVHALKGVSFRLYKGEKLGIVGESGSGKSTLIRILAALDRPSEGEVLFNGQVISSQPERKLKALRRNLQFVFQDPMSSLDPRMTVRAVIAEALIGRDRATVDRRVKEMLDAVGLPQRAADRYPHQFSGGQRQRISIARALAPAPSVLVADEPVSALDVSVRAQILNLLNELTEQTGVSMVFVSHDLAVVRRVCDTVAVLSEGSIVETGSTVDVYGNPRHEYTQALLAASPVLKFRPAKRDDRPTDHHPTFSTNPSGDAPHAPSA